MSVFKKTLLVLLILSIVFVAIPRAEASSYFFKFTSEKAEFVDTFGKMYALPHSPIVEKGDYLVPLRSVVEAAGGKVTYISKTHLVKLIYGERYAEVALLNGKGSVMGHDFHFVTKPFVVKGRTIISVHFVAKLFNGSVFIRDSQCVLNFYRIFSAKDVLGNKILLKKEPNRIVSLAPNLTEILFAIGAGSKVVGVSNYSDFPKAALSKPKVGGFFNPSIEKIFALNPDVVFVARGTPLTTINKLKSLGINVFVSDPHNINDIYDLILAVGKITGNVEESVKLVSAMKSEEKKILKSVSRIPINKRKKVYVEIWNNPEMSVGKNTFIDSLIKEAGGINITESAKGNWPVMNNEAIIKANPDVIILLYKGNVNEVKSRPGWNTISAVKNNRIFIENPDIFERPGPRIIEALKILFDILYGHTGG